jgi:hypothetical protein
VSKVHNPKAPVQQKGKKLTTISGVFRVKPFFRSPQQAYND